MVSAIESDDVKTAIVRQDKRGGEIKDMFEIYALATEFGWTYEQVLSTPAHIVNGMLAIMEGEVARNERESKKASSQARRF